AGFKPAPSVNVNSRGDSESNPFTGWAEAIGHPEIQAGLTEGQSLTTIMTRLTPEPCPALAIALYCWSTTPTAPALTLARAGQHSPAAQAFALTLCGAHQGWKRLSQWADLDHSSWVQPAFAEQLWQHWLGVYLPPDSPPARAAPLLPFGAAQTLQPRAGRSLVSLVDP
ncbi:MAG: hypothetical protein ACPGVO_00240, partial [Spirulinaceae cyanobacterium]